MTGHEEVGGNYARYREPLAHWSPTSTSLYANPPTRPQPPTREMQYTQYQLMYSQQQDLPSALGDPATQGAIHQVAHRRQHGSAYRNRMPPTRAVIRRYTQLSAADPSHEPECPICYESYNDEDHPAIRLENVGCNHIFWRNCLREWVNSGKS